MVPLPPTNREATEEISNNNSNNRVNLIVVRDANVAGIVGGENKLMPERSKAQRRSFVPSKVQAKHASRKKQRIPDTLSSICPVIAVI